VRGSLKILERVKELLHVEENGTTEDLRFTLEPVACIGACGLAPVIMINDETFGRLTVEMVEGIISKFE
jgi:NADH-quinone oxidoreductase subunit E